MKRSVWRKKVLGGFAISTEEVEELFDHIVSQFDEKDNVRIHIRFNFKDEMIEFDNLAEITKKISNKREVEDFEISASGGEKHLTIQSKELKFFGNTAVIRSFSDSETWCTGINESINSFLQGRGLWANFLADKRLLTILRMVYIFSWVAGMLMGVLYFVILFSTETGRKDLLSYLELTTSSSLTILMVACMFFSFFVSRFVNRFSTGRIKLKERNLQSVYGLLGLAISIAAMLIALLNYLK